MSTAIQKRSRGVSTKRPSRSSAAAKATEWTRRSRPPPNASRHLGEDPRDVVVGAHVALGDERARHALGEVADVLLDALALVRERDASRPRRRAASRSPTRSSAGWRRRARAPACLRTCRPRADPNRIAWPADGGQARRGDHGCLVGDRGGDARGSSRGSGWHCVLLARRKDELERIAGEIGGEWEVCDVSDRAQVDEVAARVLERHPAIGLLVNNAGIPARGSFLDVDPELIERVMAVNYLGGIWCLRAFAPGLSRRSRRARREPRLRRGNRRLRSRGRVRGLEARAAGVLALVGRAPAAGGHPGAHGDAGLRRDRGLSAALEAPQPAAARATSSRPTTSRRRSCERGREGTRAR